MPDFNGAQVDSQSSRARIAEGVHEQGITFAEHRTLIQIGCGMDRRFGHAVSLSDGSITPLPIDGEEHGDTRLFREPCNSPRGSPRQRDSA